MAMQVPIFFQGFKKRLGQAQFDFSTQTIGCALYTLALTPDVGTQEVLADLTGEVATANGYAAGGFALTGVTWAEDGASAMMLNAANTVFTAAGGNIVARYYVLYNASATGSPLIAYGLLDDTNGGTDITITDTNSATINWNDLNGIFRIP